MEIGLKKLMHARRDNYLISSTYRQNWSACGRVPVNMRRATFPARLTAYSGRIWREGLMDAATVGRLKYGKTTSRLSGRSLIDGTVVAEEMGGQMMEAKKGNDRSWVDKK